VTRDSVFLRYDTASLHNHIPMFQRTKLSHIKQSKWPMKNILEHLLCLR